MRTLHEAGSAIGFGVMVRVGTSFRCYCKGVCVEGSETVFDMNAVFSMYLRTSALL